MNRETQRYYVYECDPIDYWPAWTSLENIVTRANDRGYLDWELSLDEMAYCAEAARRLIRQHTTWEGDGSWQLSALPMPQINGTELLFAVKQNNNGTTYLCSPVRLTWLHEYLRVEPSIEWPPAERADCYKAIGLHLPDDLEDSEEDEDPLF